MELIFRTIFAIDFTPPKMTKAIQIVNTIPVIHGETPKLFCTIVEMAPC